MDHRTEARAFLTRCRARIRPEQVGLPDIGERRVPGLRREEVAALAGVSVHYYTRLERGDLSSASASVLHALSRALLLSDAEREHLFNVAAAAMPESRMCRDLQVSPRAVPAGVQQMLDAMADVPADLRNYRRDVLATNRLGRVLYAPMYDDCGTDTPNAALFTFMNPVARVFFRDWDQTADGVVANLRAEAGRSPRDRDLADLIGELSLRSKEFRVRWNAVTVRHHESGVKRLHHPIVGDLEVRFQVMTLPAQPGLGILAHSAEPGSTSDDALRFLSSWTGQAPADTQPNHPPVQGEFP